MKIRITQKIKQGEIFHMPGEILDEEKKQAEQWIAEGVAIIWEEEQSKKKKAVNDGDR